MKDFPNQAVKQGPEEKGDHFQSLLSPLSSMEKIGWELSDKRTRTRIPNMIRGIMMSQTTKGPSTFKFMY